MTHAEPRTVVENSTGIEAVLCLSPSGGPTAQNQVWRRLHEASGRCSLSLTTHFLGRRFCFVDTFLFFRPTVSRQFSRPKPLFFSCPLHLTNIFQVLTSSHFQQKPFPHERFAQSLYPPITYTSPIC